MPARPMDDRAWVRRIVDELGRAHPDARFELDFTTPLELLIALILAAQFRDERVNAMTPALFARYRTAHDYASADPAALEHDLREINFYRQKTRAVQRCAAELVARFAGEVPRRLEDLLTLPFVGRKTANVLRGNAFGDAAIGVDRHVARLAQRIGLSHEADPDRIEQDLAAAVPAALQVRLCHLLQWHGRRVCLARTPRCEVCVIQPLCDYGRKALSAAAGKSTTSTRPSTQAGSPRRARTGVTSPRAPKGTTAPKGARRPSKPAQTGRKKSSPPR